MAEKTEDELMLEAQALIDARRAELNPKPEPESEPAPEPEAQPEPVATEPAAEGEPAPEPVAEPFEGYNALPEAVRKKFDELNSRASVADKLQADTEKLRNDYNALHNRLAPVQRKLEELQRNQPKQVAAEPALSVDEWSKSLTPQMREYFRQFPEEARAQFEISRDLVDRRAKELSASVDEKFHQIERKNELSMLAREHPDYRDFALSEGKPATTKGAAFWQWLPSQPEHIQALAHSDSAADIASAITLHKWEQQPDVQAALKETQEPEFKSWIAQQPRALADALYSPRIDDRIAVMRIFDQHLRLQEAGNTGPQVARVAQIAARREQQGKASPSIRPTVAPHSAVTDGQDAGWAAAVAAARQHINQR